MFRFALSKVGMKDQELIARARGHLKDLFDRHAEAFKVDHGLTADMFTEATLSQKPVVSFRCSDREDVMEIVLDPHSGDLMDALHIPKRPKKKQP